MDPSILIPPVDDTSVNRTIFTFLLLIVIVAAQPAIVVKAANKTERVVSIVFSIGGNFGIVVIE